MSTLRFRLSEHFGVADEVCEWARVDARGEIIEEGAGAPRDWPPAESYLGIVAAGRARLIRLAVPELPPAKLKAALAFAVETRIAGDPEAQHIVAGARGTDGKRAVIVVERGWLDRALRLLADAGIVRPRLIAETQLPVVPPAAWWWNADARRGFVLTAEDGFALEASSDLATAPLPLQLALERAGPTRPKRLMIAADAAVHNAFATWQTALGVEIEVLPRWHWAALPPGRYEAACALIANERGDAGEAHDIVAALRWAAILAIAAIGLHTVFSVADWARLSWRESRVLAEAASLQRESFGADVPAAASMPAFREAFAKARHAAGQPAPGDALPLLARAAGALATLPPGSLHQARFAEGRWTLDLAQLDAASRDRLLASLSARGLGAMYAEQAGGLRIALQESQP